MKDVIQPRLIVAITGRQLHYYSQKVNLCINLKDINHVMTLKINKFKGADFDSIKVQSDPSADQNLLQGEGVTFAASALFMVLCRSIQVTELANNVHDTDKNYFVQIIDAAAPPIFNIHSTWKPTENIIALK